jgi:tyrosine-protein phosphatase YwqE
MYDFHSHIIPSVDDGSQSFEESFRMIELLKSKGFEGVVATPHANSLYFPKRDKLRELKEALQEKTNFNIILGYEVRIDAIYNNIDPHLLTIEGTEYILLEFEFSRKPSDIFEVFVNVMRLGIKPILAHPERYLYLSLKEIEDISKFKVILQVNLKSLLGFYGKEIQKRAERIFHFCELTGSDAHSLKDYENLFNNGVSLYNSKDFSRFLNHKS